MAALTPKSLGDFSALRHRAVVALALLCVLLLAGCGTSGSIPPTGSSPNPPVSSPNPPTPPATSNQWTWVSGSNLANQSGSYGQMGVPASSNAPPARYGASTWTDASGNFWLFGGITAPTATSDTYFNDLWKFSNGQWTWAGGSNTTNQSGIYGTLGTPAPGNIPGGRCNAVTWMDRSGSFWLFGGLGLDADGKSEDLNDLWRYSDGQWTWMGGPQTTITGTPGSYGTKGLTAASNLPGGRSDAVAWTDSSGNFWLFGGLGEDSAGNWGSLNDLWKYSNGQWTWVSGTSIVQQSGVYGKLGTADPANVPGGRIDAAAWMDTSGNLWLFGGLGEDSAGKQGLLNDLWEFSNGQWTWMGGSNQPGQPGVYGTQGTPSSANIPGARSGATAWTDSSGNVWLFSGGSTWPNDLWKYSDGQWTWLDGSQSNSPGIYGTLGSASSSNVPGSRFSAAAWTDSSGNLWLFGGLGNDSKGTFGYLNDLWKYHP
jgi:N-acetylneuraminic acid mutarotase